MKKNRLLIKSICREWCVCVCGRLMTLTPALNSVVMIDDTAKDTRTQKGNEETMKPFPHTVFNISITCATQKKRNKNKTKRKTRSAKYRTPYLYNTF